jgi:hypothetical protein
MKTNIEAGADWQFPERQVQRSPERGLRRLRITSSPNFDT